jgi:hypothetical protein
MSDFEDALRATMRVRDADAPTVAEFQFRPPVEAAPRRTFRWVPAVAAAACVAAVAAIIVGITHSQGHRNAAITPTPTPTLAAPVLDCPKTPPAATSATDLYPLPPRRPDTLDVTDRLVPATPPVHAVVCTYVHPHSRTLTGSRIVDNDLANIPTALGSYPPQTVSPSCAAYLSITDGDVYLIGLSYPTGTMWITAPDNHCAGSSNGHFVTNAHVAATAIPAYRSGTWATPATPSHPGCLMGTGRLGQEQVMVPATPVSVQVCRDGGAATAVVAGNQTELDALITTLNGLPTEPDQYGFTCGSQGVPTASYDLTFRYSVGPPVTINLVQGCIPAIRNGNLQSADASRVLPIVQQILTR